MFFSLQPVNKIQKEEGIFFSLYEAARCNHIKKVKSLFIIIWTICLVSSSPLLALIRFEDAVFPELVTSGRALAMGNAFICKADDSGSVFYNPAGLGTVRNAHFHLTNFHLETNKGLMDASAGGKFTEAVGDSFKAFSLEGTRQLLLNNRNTLAHNRFNLMPNIIMRYFSAGYMYSLQNRAYIAEGDTALYEFATRQDHGPFAAFNISFFGGLFKIGASGVLLNRKELIDERDKDTVLTIEDEEYQKGAAAIITAGTRFILPINFLPTFSATIHNASAQTFSKTGGASEPDPIKQTIDLGFSLTPQIGNIVRLHLEVNYKDSSQAHSDVVATRRLTMGGELDFGRKIFLRFGYGDGFGSYGMGLKTKKLEFDLTSYAVDSSTSAFQGKEDRRYSMTISSGF